MPHSHTRVTITAPLTSFIGFWMSLHLQGGMIGKHMSCLLLHLQRSPQAENYFLPDTGVLSALQLCICSGILTSGMCLSLTCPTGPLQTFHGYRKAAPKIDSETDIITLPNRTAVIYCVGELLYGHFKVAWKSIYLTFQATLLFKILNFQVFCL